MRHHCTPTAVILLKILKIKQRLMKDLYRCYMWFRWILWLNKLIVHSFACFTFWRLKDLGMLRWGEVTWCLTLLSRLLHLYSDKVRTCAGFMCSPTEIPCRSLKWIPHSDTVYLESLLYCLNDERSQGNNNYPLTSFDAAVDGTTDLPLTGQALCPLGHRGGLGCQRVWISYRFWFNY